MRAVGGALATHAEAVVPAVMKTACHAVLDTDQEKHAAEVEARRLRSPAAVYGLVSSRDVKDSAWDQ